jgi:hypothetical protein
MNSKPADTAAATADLTSRSMPSPDALLTADDRHRKQ